MSQCLPVAVKVNIEVEEGIAAVGNVVDLALANDCLLKMPGKQDWQDVSVSFPLERAATSLPTIEDGMGDFSLPRRMAGVVERPLVLGNERGKNFPGFFKKSGNI